MKEIKKFAKRSKPGTVIELAIRSSGFDKHISYIIAQIVRQIFCGRRKTYSVLAQQRVPTRALRKALLEADSIELFKWSANRHLFAS